jgi:hypothetical protein
MVQMPMLRYSLLLPLMLLLVTPCFGAGEMEGKTILKESANGSRSLRPFTVQDMWELRWDSSSGISVFLYTDKGKGVATLASSDKTGTGSTFHPTGGLYFLKIISRGDWTVTVVQLP